MSHLFDIVANFSTCLNKHDTQFFCLFLSIIKRNLSVQNMTTITGMYVQLCTTVLLFNQMSRHKYTNTHNSIRCLDALQKINNDILVIDTDIILLHIS